jgi:hypothetical protein
VLQRRDLAFEVIIEGHMAPPERIALVFGASGITGWAIVNTALDYPSKDTFSRVIALTNRPLSIEESSWPRDPRLVLQSGVDLSGDVGSILEALKSVAGIESVTHVYFSGTTFIQPLSQSQI